MTKLRNLNAVRERIIQSMTGLSNSDLEILRKAYNSGCRVECSKGVNVILDYEMGVSSDGFAEDVRRTLGISDLGQVELRAPNGMAYSVRHGSLQILGLVDPTW